MTGLAILVSYLRSLGHENVSFFQPDRLSEGYGVHAAAIRDLASRGARLIITVDTGIAAFEAAEAAKEVGVDLLITDHHQQTAETLPDTPYVVNPNQRGDTSGLSYLAGAGMAFYLCVAARSQLRKAAFFGPSRPEPDLRELLDLLVLGTVADSVELRGDNRILVRAGLKKLAFTRRPGLRALVDKVCSGETSLTAKDLAFSIAPKLNAASRMGQAHLSTELLLTQDPGRAQELVAQILKLNDQRSKVQAEIFESAQAQARTQIEGSDPPVLVVRGEWHEGVLGVVAAKLVDAFKKPAIVLTELAHGEGPSLLRGSMRTLPKVHCLKILEGAHDVLLRYGGHRMAAGLQMRAEHFVEFTERLWESGRAAPADLFAAEPVAYDGDLTPRLQVRDIVALSQMAPWGAGNPEPLLRVRGLDPSKRQILKEKHVKFRTAEGHGLIGFSKAAEVGRFLDEGASKLEALVVPEINRFRGIETVQLRIEHVGRDDSDGPDLGPRRGFFEGSPVPGG